MKKIVFIRHGKSSWNYDLPDIERPLKKRAHDDAKLIASALIKINLKIDSIYSSPANRAFSTSKLIAAGLSYSINDIVVTDDLYDFAGQKVIKFIQNIDDETNSIMIFGHNYAFTSLVNVLGSRYIDNLPTTGVAIISFEGNSWKNLNNGKTELIIFPKDLRK